MPWRTRSFLGRCGSSSRRARRDTPPLNAFLLQEDGGFLPQRRFVRRDAAGSQVTQGCDDHADEENVLEAEQVPDGAAEHGDAEGKHMVDGEAGGEGRLDMVLVQRDFLHVHRAGHVDRHEHLVEEVKAADEGQRGTLGEDKLREGVPQADHHQHSGLDLQHQAHAVAVDGSAEHRLEENPDDAADGQQRGDGLGGLLEDGYDHPGAKGQENLFARAGNDVQDVVQAVFLMQGEEGAGFLGSIRLHQEHEPGRQRQPDRREQEGGFEAEVQEAEADKDHETPQNGGQVPDGVQLPEPPPGLTLARQLHADGGGQRNEQVLTYAVDEQADHHDGVGGGDEADQQRANHGEQQGHDSQPAAAEEAKQGGDKDYQEAGQLARQFQQGSLQAGEHEAVVDEIIE